MAWEPGSRACSPGRGRGLALRVHGALPTTVVPTTNEEAGPRGWEGAWRGWRRPWLCRPGLSLAHPELLKPSEAAACPAGPRPISARVHPSICRAWVLLPESLQRRPLPRARFTWGAGEAALLANFYPNSNEKHPSFEEEDIVLMSFTSRR